MRRLAAPLARHASLAFSVSDEKPSKSRNPGNRPTRWAFAVKVAFPVLPAAACVAPPARFTSLAKSATEAAEFAVRTLLPPNKMERRGAVLEPIEVGARKSI